MNDGEEKDAASLTGESDPLDQIPTPSFLCSDATTPTERLICSSKKLADLDVEMADLYNTGYGYVGPTKDRQRAWLRYRDDHCVNELRSVVGLVPEDVVLDCLARVYRKRIGELGEQ